MDAFSYLTVLISIILGLGIAQLLASLGRCIEHRKSVRSYAPALLWAGILLLIHIQTWWSMFGLRQLADWTFGRFTMVLLQPIVLYLLAILVLPGPGSATHQLREHFTSHRRWFFGLIVALLAISVIKDVVVSGALPSTANLAFHAVFLAMTITALINEREAYQLAVASVSAILILAYVVLLFAVLR